ncbi:LysM peptidoglycan-binding domain-containing protein [Cupriavidus sp. 30B13]|uniref:LysM peptidoglycan-binding domain-containing protein n=1 Tax=Cupriavidus sp. 30B13 TaxID=3384241 RepID=UPI003B8F475D
MLLSELPARLFVNQPYTGKAQSMVAIVSGNSLGLNLTSLATLGQRGLIGNASQGRNGEQSYVNIVTGNLVLQDRDDGLVGLGGAVSVLRTYNSQGRFADDNGDNWLNGLDARILIFGAPMASGSTINRTDRDGSVAVYAFDSFYGAYVSTSGGGAYDKFTYDAAQGQYVWTDGDSQRKETYGTDGRLLQSTDAQGNTLTYVWGQWGVTSMTNSAGEALLLDYDNGSNLSRVRSMVLVNGTLTSVRTVSYEYDSSNRLSAVTVDLTPDDGTVADGNVYRTTYTYDGASTRVASINQTDGTRLAFTYVQTGATFRVATVTDALGQITSYSYDQANYRTTVTDPLGHATRYSYDSKGQLYNIESLSATGVPTQLVWFDYNLSGDVVRAYDGEERSVSYEYDANGNQTLQRDSLGNTVRRVYDAQNRLLTETIYLVPDPDGEDQLQPEGPQTTRYVYDAGNKSELRFTISAQGRVTEYRYDAAGNRIRSIEYTAGTYTVASLTETSVLAESQLATWAAAQDQRRVVRTDMTYDFRGQLQSTTTYTSVDAAGNGVADGAATTQFVYDQHGLLLKTISGTGGITQYSYDGLGRLVANIDPANQLTITQYDDANNKTSVRSANGLVTTSAYDKAGHLVGVAQFNASAQALGQSTYAYDADGRLVMSQDATGVRSWILYDDRGRKSADIDGNGTLTEYVYNDAGQLTEAIVHANAIPIGQLVNGQGTPTNPLLATVRPAPSTLDSKSWRIYDGAGRLIMSVDASGAVTETKYDGASRVISVVRYATLVNPATLGAQPAVDSVARPTSADDRVLRNFYDADGILRATLDGEGYLSELRYDAAGQLTDRITYATATDPSLRASGTLSELLPAANGADAHFVYLYDAHGQLTAEIDAENFMTERVYDAAGNVTRSVRYATKIGGTVTAASDINTVRPTAKAADQLTVWAYDQFNRVISETNAEGTITSYTYDVMGNRTSTSTAVGTTDLRTLNVRYDIQGRVVAELSAEGASKLTTGMTQAQVDAIWAQYATIHTYDAAGRRTSSTDANGFLTFYFYDADNRLTHTVNALGEVTEQQYNAQGLLTALIRYGTRINISGLTGPNAGGIANAALSAAIDAIRNPALDSKVAYTYTANGLAASATDATGNQTTFAYDAFGEEITRTSAVGDGRIVVQQTSYDKRGLTVQSLLDPAGMRLATGTVYDAFGRAIRSVDRNGNVSEASYDRLGRTVSTKDPLGGVRATTYDAFNRILTQSDALGNVTTYAYSDKNRTVTVTLPGNIVTTTTHNRYGQTVKLTDAKGNETLYKYNPNGSLIQTDTNVTQTKNAYDRVGHLIKSTDANGNAINYTYDAAGRVLTQQVDPGGLNLTTTYTYDALGNRVTVKDPRGTVTTYQYDQKGQVLKQSVDAAGLNLQTIYAYDAVGRVLTVTTPNGIVTAYAYDKAGRRISEAVDPAGLNLTTTYAYDGDGNVTSSTDANGNVTRFAYDANGNLVFTLAANGTLTQSVHDAEGHVIRAITYATPISMAGLPAVPTIADITARIVSAPASDIVDSSVYDATGRLRYSVDGTGGVIEYRYDANGNVVERIAYVNRIALANWNGTSSPTVTADPAHDLHLRTVYDDVNRPVYTINAAGVVTEVRYDDVGNVLEQITYATPVPANTAATVSAIKAAVALVANAAKDARVRTQYDAANRPTYSVDGTGAVTLRVYDKAGNLTRLVRYATSLSPGAAFSAVVSSPADVVTAFAYDAASRQVFQVDALGGVTERSYDANGNVTTSTRYATALVGTVLTQALASPTLATIRTAIQQAAGDRTERYGYDNANRAVIAIDAQGTATENTYDAVGNVVSVHTYAKPADLSGLTANSPLATLRSRLTADAAHDRIERKAYDAGNRLVYSVDALGYVKQTQYDGIGNIVKATQYALAIPAGVAPTATAIGAAVVTAVALDQVNTFAYDPAGNLVASSDALGASERYTYNGLGEKLSYTNKLGNVWTYDYDAAGRLIQETSPLVNLMTVGPVGPGGSLQGTLYQTTTVVTRYQYDALGNLLARTEAAGRPEERTTRYEYDALGRQVRTTFPPVGVYTAESAGSLAAAAQNGGTTRSETVRSLTSETYYDTLGNAVGGKDVAGNTSAKVYDALGNVLYELDAEGYVTGYTRNAFGDATRMVRYATRTSLSNTPFAGASGAPTRAAVEAAINAAGIDHSLDRAILSAYDKLGRVIELGEPQAFTYDSSAAANAQYFMAGRTTRTTYDGFGNAVQVSQLRNAVTNSWTTTTNYYDLRGNQVATVDALGYLTTSNFDAEGNVVAQTEYANAIAAGSWSVAGYSLPTGSGDDRTKAYTFDRANRKIAETRINVEYSASSNGSSQRSNLTTSYTYDAVGNQTSITDALGSVTYSYYDALGRVKAVVAPPVNGGGSSPVTTPLTEFYRDAYGNVVSQSERIYGANYVSVNSYTSTQGPGDRTSYTQYDLHGHAIQSTDATGASGYASYNERGQVAKTWQAVTGNDGLTRTQLEVYQYDKLGQLTHTVDPAPGLSWSGLNDNGLEYNAFGEVVRKGLNGGWQEYFDYDNAGHLWRTNNGDGVDRITLFDLNGDATADLRSAGIGRDNINIANIASADAARMYTDLRRTDTQYDALGRQVAQSGPERLESQGGVSVEPMSVNFSLQSATSAGDESGNAQWVGANQINLSWSGLASLGSGAVRVEVDYVSSPYNYGTYVRDESGNLGFPKDENGNPIFSTMPGVTQSRSQILTAEQGAYGAVFSWQDSYGQVGGISKVTHVRVFKQDVQGNWVLIHDQGGAGIGGSAIEVRAPADPMEQVYLQVRPLNGGGTWGDPLPLTNFGDVLRYNAAGLSPGDYAYQVLTVGRDGATHITATGSVNVAVPALATIGVPVSYGAAGAGVLAWQSPGDNIIQTVNYRLAGSNGGWQSLVATSRGNGYYGVDTSVLGAGTYEFELLWRQDGVSVPYAHATGQFQKIAEVPGYWVPQVNYPPISVNLADGVVGSTLTTDENGNPIYARDESGNIIDATSVKVMRWALTGGNVQFLYRPTGGGAWTALPVIMQGADESGNPAYQFVNISGIPPGTYEYQVLSTNANGNLIAQGTGSLTSYAQGPGHYETVNVQVQVPVTVYPPDPSLYIVGATKAQYTYPVVTATDESGNQTLGPHYAWQGSVVVAVPYTETQLVGYQEQWYTVQVPTQGPPVMVQDESGAMVPARDEAGNIIYTTVYVTEWRSQWVPVYGPVTIYPPDPNLYMTVAPHAVYSYPVAVGTNESGSQILGEHYAWQGNTVVGVPYTVYQWQTQQQQVWVPGTTPPPTSQSTTPPYTPAYYVNTVPAQYGVTVSNTSASPISIAPVVLGQVSAIDGASYWSRPTVQQKLDRWGNVIEITDPRSPYWKTTYRYNANNQVIEEIKPDENGAQSSLSPVTRITYDALGRQVSVTDANGHINGLTYDEAGNVTAELHADAGIVRYGYDAFGDKTLTIDARGYATRYGYDNAGRLISAAHAQVQVTSINAAYQLQDYGWQNLTEHYSYDQAGQLLKQSNGANETTSYAYDLRGNLISTTQPLLQVTYVSYDAYGHKNYELDPNGNASTWTYDYFGKLTSRTDLAGATYTYTYDNAKQLISQTSARGASIAYSYDAAGQTTMVRQTVDPAQGIEQVTTYAYDLAGNHVREKTVQGGVVYQDNFLGYDALNRLRDVADGQVHISFQYDKVGNRTYIETHSVDGGNRADQARYFLYDEMNRQIVVDGVNSAGAIDPSQGHVITYDKSGNRVSDVHWGNQVVTAGGQTVIDHYDESGEAVYNTTPVQYILQQGFTTEVYAYDGNDRLMGVVRDGVQIDHRYYDGAGRVTMSGPSNLPVDYVTKLNEGVAQDQTTGLEAHVNQYDANGRLLHQRTLKSNGALKTDVNYNSYDAAGNVLQYALTDYDGGYTNTYTYSLQLFDSYKEGTISGTSTKLNPGSTTSKYDVNGNLVSITDSTKPENNRTFVNDASGHVLMVNQGGNVERELVVNGEVVGQHGVGINPVTPRNNQGNPNFSYIADFDFGYQPIVGNYPNASPGAYTVQSGDTLQSIARSAYGDSALWYRIADANGLSSDRDLRVGQTLNIPNKATGVHNDGGVFKPYDPSKIVGDTTPNLPTPSAEGGGGGGGCGLIGAIIVMVVAVVVAFYTGQYYLVEEGWSLAAAGALGAAAGSVASQLVGMSIGQQKDFDFKAVGLAAIAGGVSGGLTGLDTGAGNIANAMVRAAITNAVTQGVGVVTGAQHSFNWVGVVTSAIGAGVGQGASDSLLGEAHYDADGRLLSRDSTDFSKGFAETFGGATKFVAGAISGAAAGLVAQAAVGGRVTGKQIAMDAFGNALGGSLADRSSSVNSGQEDVLGQKIAELQQSPIWNDPVSSQPGFDSNAAYNQLVGAFSQPGGTYSGGGSSQLLAANGITQPGQPVVMSDAGGGGYDAHNARVAQLQTLAGQALGEGDRYNVDGTIDNIMVTGGGQPPSPEPVAQPPLLPVSQGVQPGITAVDPVTGAITWDTGAVSNPIPYPNVVGTQLPPVFGDRVAALSSESNGQAFLRGWSGGYMGVMEGPDPSAALMAGKYLREGWDSTKQFGYDMIGGTAVDKARANFTAGDYFGAAVWGAKSLTDAGMAVFGLAALRPFAAGAETVESVSAARAVKPYSGDVYASDFVGPVQWKYFYRGDASARTDFLSSMAQERGVPATTEFLDSHAAGGLNDIYAAHGVGSQGLPTIGVTDNAAVAEYFARGPAQNQNGVVTTFRLAERDATNLAIPNYENPQAFFEPNPHIGLPEREYLFHTQIDPKFMFQQVPVKPK